MKCFSRIEGYIEFFARCIKAKGRKTRCTSGRGAVCSCGVTETIGLLKYLRYERATRCRRNRTLESVEISVSVHNGSSTRIRFGLLRFVTYATAGALFSSRSDLVQNPPTFVFSNIFRDAVRDFASRRARTIFFPSLVRKKNSGGLDARFFGSRRSAATREERGECRVVRNNTLLELTPRSVKLHRAAVTRKSFCCSQWVTTSFLFQFSGGR